MGAMDDVDDGAGADDTAAALHEQMTARHAAGDLAGALAVAEQLLAGSRQRLGPQHPDALSLAVAIANWRQHLGDLATAAEELGRLLPLLESELGADHVDTVSARHMLASYAGPGTDPLAALITWIQLFAVEQRVFGAEHETTLGARHNVAIWRRHLGDVVGAVDEMAQVVASRWRVLGEAHPDTLVSRLASATWRGDAGDTGAALADLIALVPLLGNAFGYEDEQTLSARYLCALWGQDLESRELEAVADWAVLVDDEIRALGVDHPLTVAAQTALAARRAEWEASLDEGGCPAEQRSAVEDLMERVIVMKRETADRSREFGDESLPVLRARYDLAHALWSGNQYTGAAIATDRLLDDCLRIVGDQHELTVATRALQAPAKHRAMANPEDTRSQTGA